MKKLIVLFCGLLFLGFGALLNICVKNISETTDEK